MADHQVHDLTPEEVSKGMAEGRYLLVDVREPNEVAVEAYPGGVVVPLSTFDPAAIPDPQGKQVVFACRSGKRSVTASLAAQAAGLALRQASGRRHFGLEGRGIADQDRRLILQDLPDMTSMNKVFARPSRHHLRGDVAARARQQRHQSRPGLSRRSRAGGYPARRGGRVA